MEIQVFSLNMKAIKAEADRIRAAGGGGQFGDLNFYEWQDGENNLRLMPPFNSRGMLFKRVVTHFDVPPDKSVYRCTDTWPEQFDSCPICEALDKVAAALGLDLGRIGPRIHYYANVIDRDEEEKGIQVCRFTPKSYNWVTLQIDNDRIGDIADIERGYDLVITKSEKKRRKGKGTITSYSESFIPGACPLHEKDEVAAKWLQSIPDLDQVYSPLSDTDLQELIGASRRMVTFYHSKYNDESTTSGRAGRRAVRDVDDDGDKDAGDDGEKVSTRKKATQEDTKDSKISFKRTTTTTDSGGNDKPKSSAKSTPKGSIEDVDPRGVPPCFAGLENPEPLEDGSVGFNESLRKCILCQSELRCLDAKMNKGL